MLGRDGDDPLSSRPRRRRRSVLEPFARQERLREPRPARRRGPAADAGRRATSCSAGSARRALDGVARDFYVRQLWDAKGIGVRSRRWHARAGGLRGVCAAGRSPAPTRARATAIAIAAYLGTSDVFDRALADVRRGLRRPERARPRRAESRPSRRAVSQQRPASEPPTARDSHQQTVDRATAWYALEFGSRAEFDDPQREWRRLFAEALGTFLLVLVAAGGGGGRRRRATARSAAAPPSPHRASW